MIPGNGAISKIINPRYTGKGIQYLVRWLLKKQQQQRTATQIFRCPRMHIYLQNSEGLPLELWQNGAISWVWSSRADGTTWWLHAVEEWVRVGLASGVHQSRPQQRRACRCLGTNYHENHGIKEARSDFVSGLEEALGFGLWAFLFIELSSKFSLPKMRRSSRMLDCKEPEWNHVGGHMCVPR